MGIDARRLPTALLIVLSLFLLAGPARDGYARTRVTQDQALQRCRYLHGRIDYYTDRRRLGGSATQMESWRKSRQRFERLQDLLELPESPSRVECFDISHSSGEKTVASCVVFDQNGPLKSDYRRFNIEGITGGDDYAAMEQALTRRYTRIQKEGKALPELLLIDGGKGQLGMASKVMAELGVDAVELVGVAKGTTRKPGFETLVFVDGRERTVESDDPGLHLIQQIRDEAHRFAITGHKQRRDKSRKTSTLENIPGIGPKRRRELLRYFGGLQQVMNANVDDLAKVPSISKKMAQEVYSTLHSE